MSQVTTSIRVMAKTKTQARCSGCGRTEPKWVGQCPGCAAWGTLVEETVAKGGTAAVGTSRSGAAVRAVAPAVAARPIRLVPVDTHDRARTGIAELDRVLGAGHGPDVLVLDSVQTIRLEELSGAAGGVTQVRECAAVLTRVAKARGMATLLVGHVTKDGQLAGPRVLEHLVDTVCEFDGDRHHALRLLRAQKNRFGPVGEVGCFEMTGEGLRGVDDAGRLFLGETAAGTTGVAVTLTLEGRRPLACEVQALVTPTSLPHPRRVASGLDAQRLSLLVAVLERRSDVRLAEQDVFASTVGGLRLLEPAADLALCLALASSRLDVPVARGLIALGEVGLAGELRTVAQTQRRLAEAARLGFTGALLPAAYDGDACGLRLHRVPDLRGALATGLR